MTKNVRWVTPYARAGGPHLLSGAALSAVAQEVLNKGHSFRFFARGSSMSPFIRDKDVVTLVPFNAASCAPGDVVAFVLPDSGRLVVHRVVEVARDCCRIRGDNTSEEDGVLQHALIIGTVARIERGGRPVRFGLGPERAVIALLSRRCWLTRCTGATKAIYSALKGDP